MVSPETPSELEWVDVDVGGGTCLRVIASISCRADDMMALGYIVSDPLILAYYGHKQ